MQFLRSQRVGGLFTTFGHGLRLQTHLAVRLKSTLHEIARTVPKSGRVTLVGEQNGPQTINVKRFSVPAHKHLQIVNIHPQGEGEDPKVVVKLVDAEVQGEKQFTKKVKEKKQKPRSVKEMQVSWTISEHDLKSQKRQAIESVLTRGNIIQLQIRNKQRRYTPLTPLEKESRQNLVEKVLEVLREYGVEQKPSTGSIETQLVFYYLPKPKDS